jgi:flavin-dependent dehydrogenase
MYDVIVIGARVAGASTAMLLARRGLKVLAVDRAAFPSDTLSTHQVQVPGVATLSRWGLLERVEAAATPATRRVRFDPGPVVLEGHWPEVGGVDALYSPRRRILDTLLVEAARQAGAEVRERFAVDEILFDGGRVTGIRGRERRGAPVRETARLVVGADGRHSVVAKTVRAPTYHAKPPLSIAYYTYWAGVPVQGGEMYGRERRMIGAWPTNDGLVMTYVAAPADEFAAFRADPQGSLLRSLDAAGTLGERVRDGERAERVFGTADLHNRFHKPYGPGWALVGDAGLLMDPVTGHGIGDAFRDAELLADAIIAGFHGRSTLESALAGYQARRDVAALPMYELTTQLASFAPPPAEHLMLFHALAERPAEIDRFLGVLAGAVPIPEYFSPANLQRLLGPGAMRQPDAPVGRIST